jgi:hypothetical protein
MQVGEYTDQSKYLNVNELRSVEVVLTSQLKNMQFFPM